MTASHCLAFAAAARRREATETSSAIAFDRRIGFVELDGLRRTRWANQTNLHIGIGPPASDQSFVPISEVKVVISSMFSSFSWCST